ncbi:hypothetical protein PR048_007567, partial [Dryococelus australis]
MLKEATEWRHWVQYLLLQVQKNIEIDPALLFQKMTVATVGDTNLADVLDYEFRAYPLALFESRTLSRKADKHQFAHAILKSRGNLCTADVPLTQANVQYVLDGVSLLHGVPWKPGDTYQNIANSYAHFTFHNYGRATVVFDGYDSAPSIKDMTHRRRITSNISNTVTFISGMKFVGQKCIITLISEALAKIGCTVQHADGDADFDIVHSAVSSSSQIITAVTVGKDTDLLILLLHHAKNNGFKLYFRSDIRRELSTNPVYDILGIQALLGSDICNDILFLHAFIGSDTASRIFGIRKATTLEKLTMDKQLQAAANVFSSDGSQLIDIESAGQKAMLLLYGGKIGDSLQTLQSAGKCHSFRTYYQSSVWKSKETLLTPTEWVSDIPQAAEWLLKVIHCSCKTQCATMRCGCKQNGLPCSASCGVCQISGCDTFV